MRIQKTKTAENGVDHDGCLMAYDYQNNLFYSFKHGTDDTKLEAFTLANFKKGGASSGFDRDFMVKRFATFKALVYGEEPPRAGKEAP